MTGEGGGALGELLELLLEGLEGQNGVRSSLGSGKAPSKDPQNILDKIGGLSKQSGE